MAESPQSDSNTGTKYRFTVSSAEEAVTTIRQHLGANARVISVKQKEGKGLGRFLSSPKLEVIAVAGNPGAPAEETGKPLPPAFSLPEPPADDYAGKVEFSTRIERKPSEPQPRKTPAPPPPEAPEEPRARSRRRRSLADVRKESEGSPEVSPLPKRRSATSPTPSPPSEPPPRRAQPEPVSEPEPTPPPEAPLAPANEIESRAPRPSASPAERDKPMLAGALRRWGFDAGFFRSMEASPLWERLEKLPPRVALAEMQEHIRDRVATLPRTPLGQRIAFIGSPGVGKTTALSKQLASEVFFHNQPASVLTLDFDCPRSNESLLVLCEILGVEPVQPGLDGSIPPSRGRLYLDAPGVSSRDQQAIHELRQQLDDVETDSRVLVVNAAYDNGILTEAFALGEKLGATHVVLSHLDEVPRVSRLWPFILESGLSVLFGSTGSSITADRDEDLAGLLLEKTFPANLLTQM